MTINTNRLVLALAISIFSCTATPAANNDSLVNELIQIYQGEIERLNDPQAKTIGEESPVIEQEIFNHSKFCKQSLKFLEVLREDIANKDTTLISALIEIAPSLEISDRFKPIGGYVKDIVVAMYFDSRHEDNTNAIESINKAHEYSYINIEDEKLLNQAISFYVKAKMAHELLGDNQNQVHIWAASLENAKNTCNQIIEVSKVLNKKLAGELDELLYYYLYHNDKIDDPNQKIYKVLVKFDYIKD